MATVSDSWLIEIDGHWYCENPEHERAPLHHISCSCSPMWYRPSHAGARCDKLHEPRKIPTSVETGPDDVQHESISASTATDESGVLGSAGATSAA